MKVPKSILWLSSKSPLPLNDGGRLATHALASGLAELGVEIHMLAVCEEADDFSVSEAEKSYGLSSLTVFRRATSFRKLSISSKLAHFISAPLTPLTFYGFTTKKYQLEVADFIAAHPDATVLVYDGLHSAARNISCGRYIKKNEKLSLVYRAHNIENVLWKLTAEKKSRKVIRMFLQFQAWVMKHFEQDVCSKVDALACISPDDHATLSQNNRAAAVVPMGMNFSDSLIDTEIFTQKDSLRLGFLGRLDWPANADGLCWFLEKVWPKLQSQNIQLMIAGSGDGSYLEKYRQLKNLHLVGAVEDAQAFLREQHVLICPLFIGSGTRIKVIQAATQARAYVSTALGVQGLDLVDRNEYLCAESVEQWEQAILSLKNNYTYARELGEAAFRKLSKTHSKAAAAQKFFELISECNS